MKTLECMLVAYKSETCDLKLRVSLLEVDVDNYTNEVQVLSNELHRKDLLLVEKDNQIQDFDQQCC